MYQRSKFPQLPLQLPLRDALSIYMRRLGIFAATVVGNILVVSLLLVLSQVEVVPIMQDDQSVTPVPETLALPTYNSVFFVDEFNQNLSDRWIVIQGTPGIKDGKLFSESGLLVLQLIETPIVDYSVEFSIGDLYTETAFIAWEVAPSLRYSATYNPSGMSAAWQSLYTDAWEDIEYEPLIERPYLLQLVATKDFFAVMSDGTLRSTVDFPGEKEVSPFVFSLSEGLLIEYIRLIVP